MARNRPVVGAIWAPPGDFTQTARRDLWAATQWQAEAWSLWRRLGEIHYPTTYKARAVSRLKWRVSVAGEQLDDDAGAALLELATQPLGIEEASRLIALNLEVAGAAWWVGFENVSDEQVNTLRLPVEPGIEATQWATLSVITPKLSEMLGASTLKIRPWTPDPTDPLAPDSPVRAAIGPATELITLQNQSISQSRSRIATRGIAFMPAEVSFPDGDSFGDQLLFAASAAIADPTSPAAAVPLVIEMQGDRIEQFRWEIPDFPYDERLGERVESAQRRVAIALDAPAEMLTGLGDVNHWGQWLLQEETYRAHVQPTAVSVGHVFAWTIEQLAGVGPVDVEPDATELLSRPPQMLDLSTGYQLGIVTADEWRAAAGLEPLDEAEGELAPPAPAPADPAAPPALNAPPVAAAVELGTALARIDSELRDSLVGALDMARMTARARVGARLRTQLRSAGRAGDFTDVDNQDLAAAIGGDWSQAWVGDVVTESLGGLGRWWDRQLVDASDTLGEITGGPIPGLDDDRAASVSQLVADATTWIVEGLGATELDAQAQTLSRRAVARAGGTIVGSSELVGAVP